MTVELRPLGVRCNIQCQYCYQNPMRGAGNVPRTYDLERMKAAVEKIGGPFSLFGGEPLMVPEEDLEELWSWGFQRYGKNSIQTNGALINDEHVRMFKKYNVGVGISIDGPGELNDARWAGTLEVTRRTTERSLAAIERLCDEGIPPSLIVTLHRGNATTDKLPRLSDWLHYLDRRGVSSIRLHALEVEDEATREKYALDEGDNIAAMLHFAQLEDDLPGVQFDVFRDLRRMLVGDDQNTTCVWNACDPYTTRAVQGVEGTGQRSNCGRTNKEGIDFVKADSEGLERYLALYHTPQEHGGCQGCRFFLQCKGQCPGTAIGGDWRNRTEHCSLWMRLFEHFEQVLIDEGQQPVSLRPDRERIESIVLESWAQGSMTYLYTALQSVARGRGVGESTTGAGGGGTHVDADHGDAHGDAHGDHVDNPGGGK